MRGWRPRAALLYSGTIALQYWERRRESAGTFVPSLSSDNEDMHSPHTTMRRMPRHLCATWMVLESTMTNGVGATYILFQCIAKSLRVNHLHRRILRVQCRRDN